MNPAKDVMALWQWPLTLMQTQAHFFESIMAMPVVGADDKLVGVIHLHDLMRARLA